MGLDVTKKVTVPRTAVLGMSGSDIQQHDQPLEPRQLPLQQHSAAQHCHNPSESSVPSQAKPDRCWDEVKHNAIPGQQQSLQQLQPQASQQAHRSFAQQASDPSGAIDLTEIAGNAAERAQSALQAPTLQPSQLSAGTHTTLSLGDRPGRNNVSKLHRVSSGPTSLFASAAPVQATSGNTPAYVFSDLPQRAPAPTISNTSGQRQDQDQVWGQRQGNWQGEGLHDLSAHGLSPVRCQPGLFSTQSTLQQHHGRPPVQPLFGRAQQPAAAGFGRFGLSTAAERLQADAMDPKQQHHAFQTKDCSTDAFASHPSTRKLSAFLSRPTLAEACFTACGHV